jgi:hypothetical protein
MSGARNRQRALAAGAVLTATIFAWGEVAQAEPSNAAVEEIVKVLQQRGVIDDATAQQILVKNQVQAPAAKPSGTGGDDGPLAGLEFSGDVRVRNEQFWFDQAWGTERDDRNRWRYRARIGVAKQVHPYTRVGFRVTSNLDHNSTNVSLGDSEDFQRDEIGIDQAWVQFATPERNGLSGKLIAGKFDNPLTWKHGRGDLMLWDGDITPEGLALSGGWKLTETTNLNTALGYFIIDENSGAKDPKVFAAQLAGESEVASDFELGARATWYEWRGLDDDFIARSFDGDVGDTAGNFAGAFDDEQARIGEASTFVRWRGLEKWPLLLYGTFIHNFTAERTLVPGLGRVGKEDDAWGFGFELGSAKEFALLGAGYFHVEANATPSLFTDGDLFDADTNRRGFMIYAERDLFRNVSLRLAVFDGREIEHDPPFAFADGTGADRTRLQSDISVKF